MGWFLLASFRRQSLTTCITPRSLQSFRVQIGARLSTRLAWPSCTATKGNSSRQTLWGQSTPPSWFPASRHSQSEAISRNTSDTGYYRSQARAAHSLIPFLVFVVSRKLVDAFVSLFSSPLLQILRLRERIFSRLQRWAGRIARLRSGAPSSRACARPVLWLVCRSRR